MNLLAPEDIQFRFIMSLGMETHHHAKLVDKQYGIEMEVITPKKYNGEFGKPKRYYFITGQEKEYTDLQELCDDWNEIKNYDDPNNEIFWVKKIVPIVKFSPK